MRKILLMICLGISFNGFAQIEKGTKTLGVMGQGSFQLSNTTARGFGIRLEPDVGIFLKQNFLVQSHLLMSYSNYSFKQFDSKYEYFDAGIGLSARKYLTINERFMPFGEVGLMSRFGYTNEQDRRYGAFKSNEWFLSSWATIGMSYFLTPNLAVEAGLRYDLELLDLSNRPSAFTIPIGFKYYFRREN